MSRIGVIGAGAWGTALAIQAARAGHEVALWARTPVAGRAMARLPGFVLPDAVQLVGDFPRGAVVLVVAVPMQHLRAILGQMQVDAPLLLCCKGVEAGTGKLALEVVAELLGDVPAAVLSGPNFAHEVAAGLPAAAVVAGADAVLRAGMIELLGSTCFRLYGNQDAVGVQLGGAAKNVIAIAAGAVVGGGYGENARAALITRGLVEISRLIVAQGGRAETAMGLSGLGDLVLTCTGAGSRNFAYGVALARGEAGLRAGGAVVEGVATAPALLQRAAGLDLPICAAVAEVLAGSITVSDAILRVLARKLRDEG